MARTSEYGDKMDNTLLSAPCAIGDTVYAVWTEDDGAPEIDFYIVRALMYDGERWMVTSDYSTFEEVGSNGALLDAAEAIRRFREARDKFMKGGEG